MASFSNAVKKMSLNTKKKKIQTRVLYGRNNRCNFNNNSCSFSQSMISKAAHNRKVKSLLHNNKALARSLEFSQCDVQHKEKTISSLQQALSQHMVLRLKVKEMSKTAEKLFAEINDVNDYLDVLTSEKQGESLKNNLLPNEILLDRILELENLDTISEASTCSDSNTKETSAPSTSSESNETSVASTSSESNTKETFQPVPIYTTPKRGSNFQRLPRQDIQVMEKRPGVCDLTAINEVSLVADDATLPPLLFIEEDIKKKSSVGTSKKTSDHLDRTPELIISSSYISKLSNQTKGPCMGTRKSSRGSFCEKNLDLVSKSTTSTTKIPQKIKSSEFSKINKKRKSRSNSSQSNKDRRSSITTRSSRSVSEQVHVEETETNDCSTNPLQNKEDLNPCRSKRETFVLSATIKSPKKLKDTPSRATFVINTASKSPEKQKEKTARATFATNVPSKSPEKLREHLSRATFVINTASKSPEKQKENTARATFAANVPPKSPEKLRGHLSRATFVVNPASKSPEKSKDNPSQPTIAINAASKSPSKLPARNSRGTFVIDKNLPIITNITSSNSDMPIDKTDAGRTKPITTGLRKSLSPAKSPIRSPKKVWFSNEHESNLMAKGDTNIAGHNDVAPSVANATIIFQEDMELTEVLNVKPPVIGDMNIGLPTFKPPYSTNVPALTSNQGSIKISNEVIIQMKQSNQDEIPVLKNMKTLSPVKGSEKKSKVASSPLSKLLLTTKKKKEKSMKAACKSAKNKNKVPQHQRQFFRDSENESDTSPEPQQTNSSKSPISKNLQKVSCAFSTDIISDVNNEIPQYEKNDFLGPENEPVTSIESQPKNIFKSSRLLGSKNVPQKSCASSTDPLSNAIDFSTKDPENEHLNACEPQSGLISTKAVRSSTRIKTLPKKSYAFSLSSDSESDTSFFCGKFSKFESPTNEKKLNKNQNVKENKFFFNSKKSFQLTGKNVTSKTDEMRQDNQKPSKTDTSDKIQTDVISGKRKSVQLSVNTKRSKAFTDEIFQYDSDSDFSFSSGFKKSKKRATKALNYQKPSVKSNFENPVAVDSTSEKLKDSNNLLIHKKPEETLDHGDQRKTELNNETDLEVNEPVLNIIPKKSSSRVNKMSHLIFDDPGIQVYKDKCPSKKRSIKPHLPKPKKPVKILVDTKKNANTVHSLDNHIIHDVAIVHATEDRKPIKSHGSNALQVSNNCNTKNKNSNELIKPVHVSQDISTVQINHPENLHPVVILQDTFASNKSALDDILYPELNRQPSQSTLHSKPAEKNTKSSLNSENKSNEENETENCHMVGSVNVEEDTRIKRRSQAVSYKEPRLNSKLRR